MKRRALLLALAIAAASPLPAAPIDDALNAVTRVPAGRVGIAAIDVANGRTLLANGNERFPMASTVKLAVAAAYLAEVDAGRRSLTRMITLDEQWRLGADGIGRALPHPGIALSAANYIELMLTDSDNSATDVLLADLGGPAAVTRWLAANRVEGIRIDRTIARLLLDGIGLPVGPDGNAAAALRAADALPMLTPAQLDAAAARFDADPRDTATPLAFATLLARLDRGDLLKPASRSFLLNVLARTTTGPDRIKGGVPAGTPVAHKTGTLRGISADVGLVTLPGGRRLAVAVFTRGIADGKARAKIIAQATRTLYDDAVAAR